MDDPGISRRAQLISRFLGIGSTALLISFYGYLLWSASATHQKLDETRSNLARLIGQEQQLRSEIASSTEERDELKKEVSTLKAQVASSQGALEKAETTRKNLQIAAENATAGEVQDQVLAAMRANTSAQRSEALYVAGKLAKNQKQATRAQSLFESSVREYEFAPALNALGRLYADEPGLKDLNEAQKLFLRAIEADPTYIYPLHNMSHLMRMWGRKDEARDYAERALKVDPNYEPAKAILRELSVPE